MQHSQQLKILNELLQQIEGGFNVDAGRQLKNPVSAYSCEDMAEREWQAFFREHPQIVGLSGDLPDNDTFFTLDDFGVPILATRDQSGTFRAFVNACRHRGTQLAGDRRGRAKRFVCPFHGWTYNVQGQLHAITQAQDFGAIDHSCFGLHELPACEWNGFLLIHPQPGATLDADAYFGELGEELASWHIGDRIFKGENVLDKPMNWKLANDTFGETYHFARLHKNTLNNIFFGDALHYEAFGRHHRFVFPSRSIVSLRKKPESQWTTEGVTTVLYYLFPNIQITMSERQVTLFRMYPHHGDTARSKTIATHYFSEAALGYIEDGSKTAIGAASVYDPLARDGNAIITPEASMEIIDSTVEQEDFKMGESTQQAIASGALDYLVFGRNEPALQHFHNTFRDALGMPPLEEVS